MITLLKQCKSPGNTLSRNGTGITHVVETADTLILIRMTVIILYKLIEKLHMVGYHVVGIVNDWVPVTINCGQILSFACEKYGDFGHEGKYRGGASAVAGY
ncbi:hypothetical protein ACLKA6_012636 [Drosophila palustris]